MEGSTWFPRVPAEVLSHGLVILLDRKKSHVLASVEHMSHGNKGG